ncbi:ribosome maturation factor RimM [Paenibacillus camelliae]|uniref:ribosome maturation factor RimM n=1 Tax=Paenibacillus camelliae TaxID=512410 RepID=UPI00204139A9|nr:ribosome maturation factor RimM [Paenibacillus camelliae]MCM3632062.1 ribosome maturation factor RimM [Paenibacillus camelliae]
MSMNWFNVGVIVNTHGIRGELKVLSKTDFPEERFTKGNRLMMFNDETGQSEEIEIERSREQKGLYYVKLKGFDNINDVEKYKGWVIRVSEEAQGQLDDGEYFYHQIIGCEVYTEEEELLGTVKEILSPGANDVWVVEPSVPGGKQILLPVIDPVVRNVDVAAKRITVHLLEGLI